MKIKKMLAKEDEEVWNIDTYNFLVNELDRLTAKGSPTYPSPITATVHDSRDGKDKTLRIINIYNYTIVIY